MATHADHPSFTRAKALPKPWCDHFPTSVSTALEFTPLVFIHPLETHVLAVARTRVECAWSAYVAAVPGMSHLEEAPAVLERGAKLDEAIARVLFPRLDGVPYAD